MNRPDGAAMERVLAECSPPEGLILRLAWRQGLTREEICTLRWEQVDLEGKVLNLPGRSVPLEAETAEFLRARREAGGRSAFVVSTDRFPGGMQPESVSRAARRALDRGGLQAVRLIDLRHDWILRQLQTMDWAAVSYLSGVEIPALQARFSAWVTEKPPAEKEHSPIDEFRLWKILQAERESPAGLALWLTWQLGLQAGEIVDLTWEQVDWEADTLRLPGRRVPLTHGVRRLLRETWERREAGADPHVLLSERSRKPLDLPRLSRLTRSALIRGGMEGVRLVDVKRDGQREEGDSALESLAREREAITRRDVMERLGLSRTAAYARLRRMTEQGKLVRVGGKYYLPGTVIPPGEQSAAVADYLAEWGFAYRQDIAALLGVQPGQCGVILRRMVEEGEVRRQGQRYLPAAPRRGSGQRRPAER